MCVYSDRSHAFRITKTTSITWLGTAGRKSRLSLVSVATEAVGGKKKKEKVVLSKRWDEPTWTVTAKGWSAGELAPLVGEEVFLQFADEGTGAWNHITLDSILAGGVLSSATLPSSATPPKPHNFNVDNGIADSTVLLCIAALAWQ